MAIGFEDDDEVAVKQQIIRDTIRVSVRDSLFPRIMLLIHSGMFHIQAEGRNFSWEQERFLQDPVLLLRFLKPMSIMMYCCMA
jgi:hypothetical protein